MESQIVDYFYNTLRVGSFQVSFVEQNILVHVGVA